MPVRGLYDATVPVADQSPRLREQGLRQALETVMIRASGLRDFSSSTGAPLLERTNTFLQGYGYESGAGGLQLKARFDPRAVDRSLRELGLPVWGINRLSHQVWIAIRNDGQASAVLDASGAAARTAALLAVADRRGIPLSFPDMDATDQQLANFRTVWDGDFTGIRGAARRYNPDVLVVVRVGREGDAWLSRFTLLRDDGKEEQWSRRLGSLEQSLSEGMDELADRQARRFAVETGTQQEIEIVVTGIQSLEDYARVFDYLRRLNPVRAAFVEEVGAGQVRFRLNVEGDPQLLPRVIASGSLLREPEGNPASGLRYTLGR